MSAVVIAGLVVSLFSGLALGVVWWQLAPKVPLVVRPGVSFPEGYQPQGYIAASATFGLLALIAGVAITIGLANMRRDDLTTVLVTGVLTGVLGTAAMWFVGTHLGSVDIEGLVATTETDLVVNAPLEVTLYGVFVMWPLGSAIVVTILALTDWLADLRRSRRAAEQ